MTSGHLEEPKASTSRSPFAMKRINDRHREREAFRSSITNGFWSGTFMI